VKPTRRFLASSRISLERAADSAVLVAAEGVAAPGEGEVAAPREMLAGAVAGSAAVAVGMAVVTEAAMEEELAVSQSPDVCGPQQLTF
jgi:hypothetical protein